MIQLQAIGQPADSVTMPTIIDNTIDSIVISKVLLNNGPSNAAYRFNYICYYPKTEQLTLYAAEDFFELMPYPPRYTRAYNVLHLLPDSLSTQAAFLTQNLPDSWQDTTAVGHCLVRLNLESNYPCTSIVIHYQKTSSLMIQPAYLPRNWYPYLQKANALLDKVDQWERRIRSNE